MALLCLNGPEAGLMCTFDTVPEGYSLWPERWINDLHYPIALEWRIETLVDANAGILDPLA